MSKYAFRNSRLASGLRRDFHIKAQVSEGETREEGERRENGEKKVGGGGGGGGDETDNHSKSVPASVIPLPLFCLPEIVSMKQEVGPHTFLPGHAGLLSHNAMR